MGRQRHRDTSVRGAMSSPGARACQAMQRAMHVGIPAAPNGSRRRSCCEPLEDRTLLAGVTLITHGFELTESYPIWVDVMAGDIISRGAQQGKLATWLHATIDDSGALTLAERGGVSLAQNRTDEFVVTLDWSDVSNHVLSGFRTSDVADIVAPMLRMSQSYLPALAHSLAELPVHLIGHSRGGSLVIEVARTLGQYGIWVDQVTTLDPHPLAPPDYATSSTFRDPELRLTENVVYADNYWREDPWIVSMTLADWADFNGNPVWGAANREFSDSLLSGGSWSEHSDVHSWYEATVNTWDTPVSDGSIDVPSEWFSGSERRTLGYNQSRLGGLGAPAAGLNWRFAPSGIQQNRYTFASNANAKWANVGFVKWNGVGVQSAQPGDALPLRCRYQDEDSGATIEWFVDLDRNPYNGGSLSLGPAQPVSTTGSDWGQVSFSGVVPSSVAVSGSYTVYARITSGNGGYTRYAYGPTVWLTPSDPPADVQPHITGVTPTTLSGLPVEQRQTITITGSGFEADSVLEFSNGVTVFADRQPVYVSETELRYDISVGTRTADWTVKVINPGGWESNLASFHVNGLATVDTVAPGAPTGLSARFVPGFDESLFWVDWTNPADASGIAKVWWKLGAAPTSNSDGLGWETEWAKPLPAVSDTAQTLYMWLEDGAGNRDYTHAATITLDPDLGSIAPVVTIAGPTGGSTYSTNQSVAFLSGTADDASGNLRLVWWANDRGGAGSLGGTANWASGPITLYDGVNNLTVAAIDADGNVGTDTISVTYHAPTPTVIWTGVVSDAWSNRDNWSTHVVPGTADHVLISGGTVRVDTGANVASIVIESGLVTVVPSGCLYGVVENYGTLEWTYMYTGAMWGGTLTGTLNNHGQVRISAGSQWVLWVEGSVVNNASDGIVDFTNGRVSANGLGAVINNAGLWRKAGGTGNSSVGCADFNNSGTVQVSSGTLNVSEESGVDASVGGYTAGRFEVGGAGRLGLSGIRIAGTWTSDSDGTTWLGGLRLDEGAVVRITGDSGVVSISGASTTGSLELAMTGTGKAQLANSVACYVRNDGNAEVVTSAILSGVVENYGTLEWTYTEGTRDYYGGALSGTLNNHGQVRIRTSGFAVRWEEGSVFNNAADGVVDFMDGAGVIPSSGSGAVINNAGVWRKTGGTLTRVAYYKDFNNSGTVQVSSGTLSISAPFDQAGTGSVVAMYSSTSSPGLQLSGAVLAGTIRCEFLGGYVPVLGTVVRPISWSSRTGTMNPTASGLPANLRLTPTYATGGLDLTVQTDVAVTGTTGIDVVTITRSGAEVVIISNGVELRYPVAGIASLSVATGDGNDTVTVGAGVLACTIDGGAGNDSITGGEGNDFIRGDAGNDTINGGLGNDTLMGNTGDDRIYGQDGADQIQAGLGYDLLTGGIGNDSLYAGDQMDTVYGDAGSDYIEGRGKADTIYGGAGNDTILGGAGSDLIWAEDGEDRIWVGISGVFRDTVDGGAGDDISDGDANDVLSSVESVLA